MKYLMAPIWFASFLEKASVSRTRRETRCRMVLLKRSIGPQLFRTLVTAITDVEGYDLSRLLVHSDPHPVLVGFLCDEAPHLVRFYLQTPDEHLLRNCDRQDMQVVRQRSKAGDHKAHEPPDTDPNYPADAM